MAFGVPFAMQALRPCPMAARAVAPRAEPAGSAFIPVAEGPPRRATPDPTAACALPERIRSVFAPALNVPGAREGRAHPRRPSAQTFPLRARRGLPSSAAASRVRSFRLRATAAHVRPPANGQRTSATSTADAGEAPARGAWFPPPKDPEDDRVQRSHRLGDCCLGDRWLSRRVPKRRGDHERCHARVCGRPGLLRDMQRWRHLQQPGMSGLRMSSRGIRGSGCRGRERRRRGIGRRCEANGLWSVPGGKARLLSRLPRRRFLRVRGLSRRDMSRSRCRSVAVGRWGGRRVPQQ